MRFSLPASLLFGVILSSPNPALGGDIDFNRDIRPILSDKCFHCHGPDAENQKSDYRVDTFENATASLGDYAGIVPGDPEASELVYRIETDDDIDVMPPTDSNRSLSKKEKELLRQWIAEGAGYDEHWAFQAPVRPEVPEGKNAIDHFIREGLEGSGLSPSERAPREHLIRRVTLDLTGLPPTPEEVAAFLTDESPDAYEKVIDRLLASPAYGERMAQVWLDATRYADSAGYQNDFKRSQWPWRDWVIDAYNRNLPFDEFSIQQIAGDLLPDADDSTRLATAYGRNHRINNEGGIIPAEFLVEYVADRVETTSTVWLGLTVGCARCHDHKYDPISMRDFYQLFAFFHNVPEKGKDGAIAPAPNMNVYTGGTREEHETLQANWSQLQKEKTRYARTHRKGLEDWKKEEAQLQSEDGPLPRTKGHYPFDFVVEKSVPNLADTRQPAEIRGRENHVRPHQKGRFGQAIAFSNAGHVKLARPFGNSGYLPTEKMSWSFFVQPGEESVGDVLSCLSRDPKKRGYRVSLVPVQANEDGKDLAVSFRLDSDRPAGKGILVQTPAVMTRGNTEFTHVSVTWDGSLKAKGATVYIDGQPVTAETKSDTLESDFALQDDHLLGAGLSFAVIDELHVHRAVLPPKHVARLARLDSSSVVLSRPKPTPTETAYLERVYYDSRDPGYQTLLTELDRKKKALDAFERNKITQVSIMEEMPEPRATHLLLRGAYDQPDESEVLSPDTFDSLPPMPPDAPRNRLGFAQWLFQKDNPLTARVAANRYWQMLFGTGLVKTPEDFGFQGSIPSHPELLDWLAVEFRENGWNVKKLLKQILMSETYCQDSRVTAEQIEIDPSNWYLSRGPRFRLSAFALRDQALAASGLLVADQGGPPVMPYQPAGLWEEVSAKGFKYVVARDEGLYRRSLYTFWRRTVPPPSMMNFDAAGREACSVNLSITNTPLQAMNLLNDPQFVEAARALGERMMEEADPTPEARITHGTRLLLGRAPSDVELNVFLSGYRDYLQAFTDNPAAAEDFVSVGQSRPNPDLPVPELAACAAVASVLLNLDETVTKE